MKHDTMMDFLDLDKVSHKPVEPMLARVHTVIKAKQGQSKY